MLLEAKQAVIYGGGGTIGGAVALAFAREGATVHLAGRTLEKLEKVAGDIHAAGGKADTAKVDALDEAAVDAHADRVDYSIGGFQIALTAVEALRRQLASELGRHGIRAVSLVTGGIIDAIPDDFEGRDALVDSLVAPTMLGRGATLEDVGNVAAFAASDSARTITGSAVNISCGAIVD